MPCRIDPRHGRPSTALPWNSLAHTLGDFAALEWPFESGRLLRAFIAGVTYAEARAAYRREILPQDCVIGADPRDSMAAPRPRFTTASASRCRPASFRSGRARFPSAPRGPPSSILAYATNPRSVIDVVVKALAGFSSLYHAPWTRSKGQLAPTALLPRPPPPPLQVMAPQQWHPPLSLERVPGMRPLRAHG